ncbi:MAG: hypothetical protein MSA31_08120 [Bacteroidales bacterium]|nr:hypothetical protein [Bacteroidales bacterium]
MVLEDNRDNNNNRKNGRNCGCHEVTYNRDNRITVADPIFFASSRKLPVSLSTENLVN